MDWLIHQAHAQDAGQGGGLGGLTSMLGNAGQFLPIILIFGVFYFLLIRPQQQQQKTLKATLSGLKRGDRIVTGGGMLAVVLKVRDGSNEVEVELSPNSRATVLRETISSVIKPTAANDAKPTTKAG